MIHPSEFFNCLQENGVTFFSGVPDSLLKHICAYITDNTKANQHITCANEGNSIGVAIGYHLASGKIPLVYMQNSGLGNAINPLLSLADKDVYSIPVLMMIGWRGEPGIRDEPQHKKQGTVTLALLETMEIPYEIITGDPDLASEALQKATKYMKKNKAPFALVVQKNVFEAYTLKNTKESSLPLEREDALKCILDSLGSEDIVVSTTGMISREVFELREILQDGHCRDFLTVGGMGHTSQIALGIALLQKNKKVYCLDGDGSVIMHMGCMAINGALKCPNFYHIVLNNGVHDSVGGQPTVGFDINLQEVAKATGYETVLKAITLEDLEENIMVLKSANNSTFLEISVNKGHRCDLGRPTTLPIENKVKFMENFQNN